MPDEDHRTSAGVELPAGPRTPTEEARWRVAYDRERRVRRILADEKGPGRSRHSAAVVESEVNGYGWRTLTDWCEEYERAGLVGLLPRPKPKTRRGRLPDHVETAIAEAIDIAYLTPERGRFTAVDRVFSTKVAQEDLVDIRTIKRRIHRRDPEAVTVAREGAKAARERFAPHGGGFLPASRPLEFSQTDHSVLDLEVVHPTNRQVMGRPTLSIVVDIFTRAILAVMLSMRKPSSLLTAQVMTRAINPKARWLASLGLDWIDWPFAGPMRCIHTDHGRDLTANPFEHGCDLLGIEHPFRRIGVPDDGGHVERMIRTVQAEMAELPGKTFSNVLLKAAYDSEGRACLSLEEAEKIIAIELYRYHHTVHSSTGYSPMEMWLANQAYEAPRRFEPDQIRCAFLPFIKREKIQQYGLQEDYCRYNSPEVTCWIGRKHPQGGDFIFAYDEREEGWMQFFDPSTERYFPVPCTVRLLTEGGAGNLNQVKRENKGRRTPHDVNVRAETEKQKVVAGARAAAKKALRAEQADVIPPDMVVERPSYEPPEQPRTKPVANEGASQTAASARGRPFVDPDNVVAFPISHIRSRWAR